MVRVQRFLAAARRGSRAADGYWSVKRGVSRQGVELD